MNKYLRAIIFAIFAFNKHAQNLIFTNNFFVCKYIAICVKTLTLLVSKIQSPQNAKFYSCQINLVYSIEIGAYTF